MYRSIKRRKTNELVTRKIHRTPNTRLWAQAGWQAFSKFFSPAKTLAKCDNLYSRMPPAPIAFIVRGHLKKKYKANQNIQYMAKKLILFLFFVLVTQNFKSQNVNILDAKFSPTSNIIALIVGDNRNTDIRLYFSEKNELSQL